MVGITVVVTIFTTIVARHVNKVSSSIAMPSNLTAASKVESGVPLRVNPLSWISMFPADQSGATMNTSPYSLTLILPRHLDRVGLAASNVKQQTSNNFMLTPELTSQGPR